MQGQMPQMQGQMQGQMGQMGGYGGQPQQQAYGQGLPSVLLRAYLQDSGPLNRVTINLT
jgi:hypothetical protein